MKHFHQFSGCPSHLASIMNQVEQLKGSCRDLVTLNLLFTLQGGIFHFDFPEIYRLVIYTPACRRTGEHLPWTLEAMNLPANTHIAAVAGHDALQMQMGGSIARQIRQSRPSSTGKCSCRKVVHVRSSCSEWIPEVALVILQEWVEYFYILLGPHRSVKKIFKIRNLSLCGMGKTNQVLNERRRNEFWPGDGNDFLPLSTSSGTSINLTQIKGMMKEFQLLQFSVALSTYCAHSGCLRLFSRRGTQLKPNQTSQCAGRF